MKTASRFRKPMLAKTYQGNEHRVNYPCYVQPKLDGIRCVTDGRTFWSRNGKKFPVKNIRHLQLMGKLPFLVDGELFIPDGLFEDIVSGTKNASTLDRRLARKLRFCVFDVINDEPFSLRTVAVESAVANAKAFGAKWKMVKTMRVQSSVQLDWVAKNLVEQGHEGAMVRNAKGMYVSRRTHDLLKLKPMMEAEFTIVDVKEAKGKDKGTPIFICKVGKTTFRVRPMGSMKQRRRMWRDRKQLIGAPLTVEFQNYTKHGKPRFPRAKVIRDYE